MNDEFIIETYNNLGSIRKTAKKLHMDKARISNILRKNGIDPNGQNFTNIIREDYMAGYGKAEILARHPDIKYSTICRVIQRIKNDESTLGKFTKPNTIPLNSVPFYWLKTKDEHGNKVSLFVNNKDDEALNFENMRESIIKEFKDFIPNPPKITREDLGDSGNLLVLDPADVHIGKVTYHEECDFDYNLNNTVEELYKGVAGILAKAKKFGIAHICLVAGNDILHYDGRHKTTTKGTDLVDSADSVWFRIFETARRAYINIIEMCKKEADVTVIFCPSNHDNVSGFYLMDSIFSYYSRDENVNISNYGKSMRHRKYIQYGNSILGFTHGDGARAQDLGKLMSMETKDTWATTNFAYFFCHHLHHKIRLIEDAEVEKDYSDITVIKNTNWRKEARAVPQVEYIRSPTPTDSFHIKMGYANKKAIEAFLISQNNGMFCRFTEYV